MMMMSRVTRMMLVSSVMIVLMKKKTIKNKENKRKIKLSIILHNINNNDYLVSGCQIPTGYGYKDQ